MFDAEALGAELADLVKGHLAVATAPLLARISDLESNLSDFRQEREDARARAKAEAEKLISETSLQAEELMRKIDETSAKLEENARRSGEMIERAFGGSNFQATGEAPLSARITSVEMQLAARESDPFPSEIIGRVERIEEWNAPDQFQRMVDEAVAKLPAAKDGEPGKDADPEHIAELVRASTDTASADILARVEALIPTQVHKAVASIEPQTVELNAEPVDYERIVSEVRALIPAPENGKDADPVETAEMVAAEVAKAVSALPVARDGVSLAGAIIDRGGNLVVTLSDGTTRDLGPVVGKDGEPGQPGTAGLDGFKLEDFDSEIRDGGRTIVLRFEAGDITHTVEHQLDTMIYRGAYKPGQGYSPGDTVSCGGQLYHCNHQTQERPDGGSEAWTLCSRRGRDGKDADPAPILRLVEEKFADTEARIIAKLEAFIKSKGL